MNATHPHVRRSTWRDFTQLYRLRRAAAWDAHDRGDGEVRARLRAAYAYLTVALLPLSSPFTTTYVRFLDGRMVAFVRINTSPLSVRPAVGYGAGSTVRGSGKEVLDFVLRVHPVIHAKASTEALRQRYIDVGARAINGRWVEMRREWLVDPKRSVAPEW